ncbi:polysaccharide pyruvyl transferase family protein [Frateuria sp. GZRR35]|uniref:polysaccharide pyruvyl transferase family protein n=1 Tax=Frateuria sp. GZRR35 TaxID=3351536 RepID=UPI003EDC4D25
MNFAGTEFNALAVGWYGAPNVGDEALLAVLKRQIAELGGSLMIASADPAMSRKMHGIDAVDFNNLGEIAGALQWADILIMGGGGIFQDHHPFRQQGLYDPVLNDIAAYARPILMARQFGVPVIIWGHGVGPLDKPDSRDVVREVFDMAAAVSVRDPESLRLLRQIGVTREVLVGPDPGWLYARSCAKGGPEQQPSVKSHQGRTLALVVREWSLEEDWKDKLVGAINSVVPDGWSVEWVAFQANIGASGATSDLALLEELRSRVPDWAKGTLLTPATPYEAWTILSSADAIVSMRLHASILGLLARKPVAGLEYDEKMSQAHIMAGLPPALRVALRDPAEHYARALATLMGGQETWKPSDDQVSSLEEQAMVHLKLLSSCRAMRAEKKQWKAGNYDWLGTWLQQSLGDLRATKAKSQLAHELLDYRDIMLAERDAQLEAASASILELRELARGFEENQRKLQQAEHTHETYRAMIESELKEERERGSMVRNQLAESQERLELLLGDLTNKNIVCDRQREDLKMLQGELSGQTDQIIALGDRARALQLELEESADELLHRDAYIQDKEIYIAQLVSRVNHLEGELSEVRLKVAQTQQKWRRLTGLLSVLRRDAIRIAAAPFKIAAVWRRHGLRVATQQFLRRISTFGRSLEKTQELAVGAGIETADVRPVRVERLLVIAGSMQENGWPTRAAALAAAGDRAGFFVRVWHVGATSDQEVPRSCQARLLTSDAGLLREVTDTTTRILLADLSAPALEVARMARERGAQIILDLSSVDMSDVVAEQIDFLRTLVDRAVSRDGAGTPFIAELEVERLADAGDNEEFDSYMRYPYPQEFRKRRRNILLIADGVDAGSVVDELALHLPHDHIVVDGGLVADGQRAIAVTLDEDRRASFLAAADVVLVANGGRLASQKTSALINAALLLERPVITDASVDAGPSANLHILGQMRWSTAINSVEPREDYHFVSRNCWLGRVEQLMRGEFPSSVSVVVLIHNNRRIIERCVSTMLEHCAPWLHELVIVDNQSSDGGADLVEQLFGSHPKVTLLRNTENGCSSGRNLGVKASTGRFVAFFDSDQWLTSPSCFAEAVHILETEPTVGAIGWNAGWFDASRSDLGGTISDYVPRRGMNASALAKGYRDDIGFLGTSGMFMRKELFERIEGFDTFYDPTCFEDTDICFQIKKAGFRVALRDLAGIRHQPHQTTGASEGSERYRKLFIRNADYFRRKWSGFPDFFVDYSA